MASSVSLKPVTHDATSWMRLLVYRVISKKVGCDIR